MNSHVPPPPLPPETPSSRPRFHWLLFLFSLLAPALLTCLSVFFDKSSNGPAPGVAIIGGAFGGIGCGIILGRRLGRTPGLKILFGVLFAAVCGVVSIALAMFGCLATGYNLNFH